MRPINHFAVRQIKSIAIAPQHRIGRLTRNPVRNGRYANEESPVGYRCRTTGSAVVDRTVEPLPYAIAPDAFASRLEIHIIRRHDVNPPAPPLVAEARAGAREDPDSRGGYGFHDDRAARSMVSARPICTSTVLTEIRNAVAI